MSTPQLPLSSNSKTKMFSLSGHPKIIIIKENTQLTLRSALIVAVTPFKHQQLFPVIDLFHDPFSISLSVNLFSLNKIDSYSCIFFLDLDVSQALTDDFNKVMKESIHMLKLKLDLLFKTIALKNFEVS